jgi:3-deoxy-manno-octulosonate cytidylyltransferase (CMP-KDO synthetase)
MKSVTLIPARMGSSRFPGKPLERICGKPMIEHVYRRSALSSKSCLTAVATCDHEIYEFVTSIGGHAIMTSSEHVRASDRCAEALAAINAHSAFTYDHVVMVQGDEPVVQPAFIDQTVNYFKAHKDAFASNIAGPFLDEEEFLSENSIKVVSTLDSHALYFSRRPIPYSQPTTDASNKKQVCVIGFSASSLEMYSALDVTALEVKESIDMLRILQHGYRVRLLSTESLSLPVDVPGDIERVTHVLQHDKLFQDIFHGRE